VQQLSNTLPKNESHPTDLEIKNLKEELKSLSLVDFQVRVHNDGIGNLKYVDCLECKNKGDVASNVDGYLQIKECRCMKQRKIMKRIEDSGLSSQFANYRFDNFKTDEAWQKSMKDRAIDYLNHFNDKSPYKWLYIGGQIGSGKTHIESALMRELIQKGFDIAYMQFSEEMPDIERGLISYGDINLKALSMYERFKTVEILVIDDAFKNYTKQRAFWDIINHRYKDGRLVTIISSQYSYDQLVQITGDESLPSRIFERCTEKYFRVSDFKADRNQRTKGIGK
jgi:DNA replication protein DnaC